MAHGMGLLGLILVCIAVRLAEASLFQACGTPSCLCFPDRAIAACARLGARMTRVPSFRPREVSGITGINLSRQAISRVRPADFLPDTWSALQWIDLRENPGLDCSSLKVVPAGIKVLSDCPQVTPGPQLPHGLPQLPHELPHSAAQVGGMGGKSGKGGKGGKSGRGGRGRDKAQSDASSSSSVSVSVGSSSSAAQARNKTKGKEVVIPFKGYFKLYLPEL